MISGRTGCRTRTLASRSELAYWTEAARDAAPEKLMYREKNDR
jgi:hypothetical protein